MTWAEFKELANIIIGVVIVVLLVGRWIQAREGGEKVARKDITKLNFELEKLFKHVDGEVQKVLTRIDAEHVRQREFIEKTNTALGRQQVAEHVLQERVNRMDDDVRELRRKVYNGGASGV